MSIREYIKRRFRDLLLIMIVVCAAIEGLLLCVQQWPKTFAAVPWSFLVVAAPFLWLVIAWFAIKLLRIACPRCSNPLGAVAVAGVMGIMKIDRCPHCRVDLDEPVKPTDPK
jgi:hypothetical protein